MDARSLKYVAAACDGELLSGAPDTSVRRISTDSRAVQREDLFIALQGDRFDGHHFLHEVVERGASAVVVNPSKLPRNLKACPVIAVENTREALGKFAARYRQDFSLPLIAVAGSNGKTTTKELIAAVLRQKLKVVWSPASFNNEIGVPLTLLNLDTSYQAGVVEVGTNHPGELAPLVGMVQPRYGVITNIGREHLEFFKDVAGVAEEEGWLAELLPPNGKLYINGDCPELAKIAERSRATVVRVGQADANDWRARGMEMSAEGVRFQVDCSERDYAGEYRLKLIGRHQVLNALFAIGVGKELGLSRAEIQRGLAECPQPKMRLEVWKVGEVQVLDDSYNANADSMRAALQTLGDFPCGGRRIAVLGDMAELGEHGVQAHAEVGCYAAQYGVNNLFAVGKMASTIGAAARESGLDSVSEFASVEDAAKALRVFLRSGDVVLLKASRATRLERVGDFLRSSFNS